jgi:1,4-dihydroxy-6-naphthoate synthase
MTTSTDTTLTLAHSPDADDLVMFWPLTGIRTPDATPIEGPLGKPQLDTAPFTFDLIARDVEELNQAAIDTSAPYDITAISCAAYPRLQSRYRITRSGASFGENYGPKLVVRTDSALETLDDFISADPLVAVPGLNTSAFMTLNLIKPGVRTDPMLFSAITNAVTQGRADAGLLIHEAQLTFEDLGLRAIGDMGQWWFTHTNGLPLPLGLNVIARSLDTRFGPGTTDRVSDMLSESIRIAHEQRDASKRFLKLNMGSRTEWNDDALIDRYLDMYVSPMTLDMGDKGRSAIARFLAEGASAKLCPSCTDIDIA